jgi:hypothetical protein
MLSTSWGSSEKLSKPEDEIEGGMYLQPQLLRGLRQDLLSPGVQGQPGQHDETLCQKKKKEKE